jgi:DMSO/TMAO reductase YedYZ molybdopterin-dependent catalytic subunit
MIHLRRICFVISIFVALVPAIYGQSPQASTPEISLSISGEVERPLKLTGADLAKLPRRTIRAKDHGGNESEYEGRAASDRRA